MAFISKIHKSSLDVNYECKNCIQMKKLVTSTKRSILIILYHDGILSGVSHNTPLSCRREEAPIDAGISQFWEAELVVDLFADDPLEIRIFDLPKFIPRVLTEGEDEVHGILSGVSYNTSLSCIRKEAPIDAGISQFREMELVLPLQKRNPRRKSEQDQRKKARP